MGLRVSDFNINELKGKRILSMKIDAGNESTITVEGEAGKPERHRIPAVLVHMLDWYAKAA